MTTKERTRPRIEARLLWFALAWLPAAVLALLMRTELASPLAPFAGPWAGCLYGHSDCTMASALPGWSYLTLALLPVVGLIAWRWRSRALATVPLLLWFIAWELLALLSVLNSTS